MNRYKPITVSAGSGGRLAADVSANELGVANWRVKRDWRRYKDRERRREGYDYFRPNLDVELGTQPLYAGDPINLIYGAKSESGKRAVIAGTAGKIYRYFWSGKYVSDLDPFFYFDPTDANSPYIETPPAYVLESPESKPYFSEPYVKEDFSGWTPIGQGYASNGYRWEALNVGDDIVFNNGVDLPFAHALNEFEVTPLHELREQGVAAVGTIAEFNGILMCADILQIKASKMLDVFMPKAMRGTASQTGATFSGTSHATQAIGSYEVNIVSGAFVFTADMVGKRLRFRNGFAGNITAYNSPTQVVIDSAPGYVGEVYGLEMASDEIAQTIAVKSGALYLFTADAGTLKNGLDTVRSGEYFFPAGPTVTLSGSGMSLKRVFHPASGNNDMPFYILNPDASDRTVVASDPVFTADMVGLNIYWDSGDVRKISAVVSPYEVTVEIDAPIASGKFSIENALAYGRITDPSLVDRRGYRVLWSDVGKARRFSAEIPCSIKAKSRTVVLQYPVRSFSAGQDVIVLGAGPNGGNLIAKISYINSGRNRLILDTLASTTVEDSLVQSADALGSIVSFEDLEQDGSRIIRMLDLNDQLVIYRSGGYQVAAYSPSFDPTTGAVITAFKFSKLVKTANTLAFKHSLITVSQGGVNYHVFAGATRFFRFDMTSRIPVPWEAAEMNNSTFYSAVSAASTFASGLRVEDYVFAADNALTREIWMVFPGHATEKALCFDYEQGTMSTTSMVISAAATLAKPTADNYGDDKDQWYVMGGFDGVLLLYGLVSTKHPLWQSTQLMNRLGEAYDSELYSGLGHFGSSSFEKHINGYTVEMSSFTDDLPVKVEIYGAKNPNSKEARDAERLLGGKTFSQPSAANFFPVHYLSYYLADRIVVSGKDNPVELSARTFRLAPVNSAGQLRLS